MLRNQNNHPIKGKTYPILQFLDTDFVFLYYQVDFILTTSKPIFLKYHIFKYFQIPENILTIISENDVDDCLPGRLSGDLLNGCSHNVTHQVRALNPRHNLTLY